MQHIAIDLGSKESQICIVGAGGTSVEEKRVKTKDLGSWLKKRPAARLIFETCAESRAIARLALEAGHQVCVVPSTFSRVLGVGQRGLKTDRRDARALAEASFAMGDNLKGVHLRSTPRQEQQDALAAREALVECRTKLINHVRSMLRMRLQTLGAGGRSETFPARVRAAVEKHELGYPASLERHLKIIEELNDAIAKADEELRTISERDPVCRLLKTMPGVGVVTSVSFACSIDEVERFENGARVASYLGLTPGEKSSGSTQRRTGLTKAGSKRSRWALIQAAWTFRRLRPDDPMVQWAHEVEKRRGKRVAIAGLARKMATALYAMWRDDKAYDPTHQAKQPATA